MGFGDFFLAQKGADASRGLSMMIGSFLSEVGIIIMLADVIRVVDPHGGEKETVVVEQYTIYMCAISSFFFLILFTLGYTGRLTVVPKKTRHKSFIRAGMLLLGSGGLLFHGANIAEFITYEPECRPALQAFFVIIMEMTFIMFTMMFLYMWCEIEIVNNVWMIMFVRFMMTQIIATSVLLLFKTVMLEALEQILMLENTVDGYADYSYSYSYWYYAGYEPHALALVQPDPLTNLTAPAITQDTPMLEDDSVISSLHDAVQDYVDDFDMTDHFMPDLRAGYVDHSTGSDDHGYGYGDDHGDDHHCPHHGLAHTVSSYSFPLLVEYCVVSLSIQLMFWDEMKPRRSGHHPGEDAESHAPAHEEHAAPHHAPQGHIRKRAWSCLMHHYGTILGWVLLLLTIIVCLNYLYVLVTEDFSDIKGTTNAVYGCSMSVALIGTISLPLVMYRMKPLTYCDNQILKLQRQREGLEEEHEDEHLEGGSLSAALDKGLLVITNAALVSFKLLNCVSVINTPAMEMFGILADGVITVLHAYCQTMFITYYASRKVVTKEEHRQFCPGRQGLYFVRCVNLSLWLINTFLLKHPTAKLVQLMYYGSDIWVLISNVISPLTTLYYFHSFVFLSDINAEAYKGEYLGIVRPTKEHVQETKEAEANHKAENEYEVFTIDSNIQGNHVHRHMAKEEPHEWIASM